MRGRTSWARDTKVVVIYRYSGRILGLLDSEEPGELLGRVCIALEFQGAIGEGGSGVGPAIEDKGEGFR